MSDHETPSEASRSFGALYEPVLAASTELASAWLRGVPDRRIVPTVDIEDVKDALGRELPGSGEDAAAVVHRLAAAVEPGLMAMQSPRFFGWVIGGTHPAALGADWLVSAWDQNSTLRTVTPGVNAAEELAGEWLLDLLGLPDTAAVGFTTGATVANTIALAAARHRVLQTAGWDDVADGIQGAPRIRVIAGAERHPSVDVALRYLGLGLPELVGADEQGRIFVDRLADALADASGPIIVCLQAGNIHSGACDDFERAVAIAHEAGAWVHIDGAFGLWAAASPRYAALMRGAERADSWATDAHKTLNVPYDSGIAAVADPVALVAAMTMHAAYLPASADGIDQGDRVLELSRRARGVPVWAALRALGRDGVVGLVDGLGAAAQRIAEGVSALPGARVLNDVVFTQVCVAFDGVAVDELAARLDVDGTALAHPSHWRGHDVLRFSVSDWMTDDVAVDATIEAVRRALAP